MPFISQKMIEAVVRELSQNPCFTIIFGVFLFTFIIQLFWYWLIFRKIAFPRKSGQHQEAKSVSVVVVSSNQYDLLRSNLPEILNQDYPNYEVIVVNEISDNDSCELLERFSEQYAHLRVINIQQTLNWFKGIKFPLSIGIKSAKNEIVLVPDIFSRPVSNKWIKAFAESYGNDSKIVLGYTAFQTPSGINWWYRFAGFYDAINWLSLAGSGLPVTCAGQNLSFTRSLFFGQQGFISHYDLNAGADELFVNRAARTNKVGVQISKESRMINLKPLTLSQWLLLEKTKLAIRRRFRFFSQLLLAVHPVTAGMFYLSFVWLLSNNFYPGMVIAVYAFRLINQLIISGFVQKQLSEKKLWLFMPVFEPVLLLVYFSLIIKLLLEKEKKFIFP